MVGKNVAKYRKLIKDKEFKNLGSFNSFFFTFVKHFHFLL